MGLKLNLDFDTEWEPTPTCQCDEPQWELRVEESQAELRCAACDEHHWSIDAPEYLTLEAIPVTVEEQAYHEYWSGAYEVDLIVEPKGPA